MNMLLMANAMLGGILAETPAADGNFKISNLLKGLFNSLESWGKAIVMIIGVVMVIVGVYKVAKGLISHGKTQTNWVVAIALIVLGGVLCATGATGWTFVQDFAKGGKASLDTLGTGTGDVITDADFGGTGTILNMLRFYFMR